MKSKCRAFVPLNSLALVLCVYLGGTASGFPSVLSPHHLEQLRERERLGTEATDLDRRGQLREAIAAGKKKLAIERDLLGNDHDDVVQTLEWLVKRHIAQDDLSAAKRALEDVRDIFKRRKDAKPWDIVDARVNLSNVEQLAEMTANQRAELIEAERQINTAGRLSELGRTKEAIALADKGLAVRRRLLGAGHRLYAEGLLYQALRFLAVKDFARAEDNFGTAETSFAKVLGREHRDYATAVNGLGIVAFARKDYAQAEEHYRKSLDIRAKVLGTEHETHIANVRQLADVYDRQLSERFRNENYKGAREVLEKASALEAGQYGEQHWRVKQVRLAIAHLERTAKLTPDEAKQLEQAAQLEKDAAKFKKQDRLGDAIKALEKVLAIRRAILGEESPRFIECLEKLAALEDAREKLDRAADLYDQAIRLGKAVFGERHPTYLESLDRLALRYREVANEAVDRGDFVAGRKATDRVLALRKEATGEAHWQVRNALVRLNEIERLSKLNAAQRHRLAEADDLVQAGAKAVSQQNARAIRADIEKALSIYEELQWHDTRDYAWALLGLGWVHDVLGEFPQAERRYMQSLKLEAEIDGTDHPRYAGCLNNLGTLCTKMADYMRAEQFLSEALRIKKKVRGGSGADFASTINNLGMLYVRMRDYSRAEPLLREAYQLLQGSEEQDQYARALNNLAGLYLETGDGELAEPLFEEASNLWKRQGALVDYARSLDNRARLAQRAGDLDRAERLYKEAQAIFLDAVGDASPDYAISLCNLASCYAGSGKWGPAADAQESAFRVQRRHVDRVLPGLSDAEQLLFRDATYEPTFHGLLALGLARKRDAEVTARSAEWIVNGKAVIQAALAERALLAKEAQDPKARELVQRLLSARDRLAALTMQGPPRGMEAAYRKQLASLTASERDLAKQVGQITGRPRADDPWVDLAAVRKALAANSVLIEFARFTEYEFRPGEKPHPLSAHYAAWVIPPTGKGGIHLIDLGEAQTLEDEVWAVRETMQQAHRLIARVGESAAQKELFKVLKPLSERLLKPLSDHIGRTDEWILSPDADLWLVPWAALLLPDGRYVAEGHGVRYLVTGRDLAAPSSEASRNPAALFADPEYGPTRSGSGPLRSWQGLEGTRREATAIAPLLKRHTGETPLEFFGNQATETAFKAISRPRALLLSTHGFFLPDLTEAVTLASSGPFRGGPEWVSPRARVTRKTAAPINNHSINPLLRCGLVLAGANRVAATDGGDDGLLTGLEILGCDLLGTELVVLSACETGIGDRHAGEGVAGLRQAFQLAGARSVVATQWKIPDDETVELMTRFFGRLADEKDASVALRKAQLEVIKERRAKGEAAHPFYWAAFAVTGR